VSWLTWDESGRYPVYWPDGDRYIAGRNLAQASLWNLGTCTLMLRENSKWWTHKDESIDAMYRGGTIRSSDEVPVMGMERRDCIIRFWTAVNLGNKGGTNGQNKASSGWIMGAGWGESLKSGSERAWGWNSPGLLTNTPAFKVGGRPQFDFFGRPSLCGWFSWLIFQC
jgi:hypothetical protein